MLFRSYEKAKAGLKGKGDEVKEKAEELKGKAKIRYERHTSPAMKETVESVSGKLKGKAEELKGKAEELKGKATAKGKEVEEKVRRHTGTETPGMLARDAMKHEGAKAKLKGLGQAAKRVGEKAEDVAREAASGAAGAVRRNKEGLKRTGAADRKSTRLNSSH